MNVQEMVKFQVMSNMTRPAERNTTLKDLFIQVILMFFMGLIDDICKAIPKIIETVKERWSGKLHKRLSDVLPFQQEEQLSSTSILLDKRHNVNSVRMMRVYATDRSNSGTNTSSSTDSASLSEMNHKVDAILSHVAHLDNIPTMQLIPNGHFMVSYKDKPIQITKDIFMKIDEIKHDSKTGHITAIVIVLVSNTISASDISQYVDNLYKVYQEEMKNSLGKNIYFFDQKFKDTMPPRMPVDASPESVANHRRMMIQSAPKQLSFTMTPFYSNKRFNNIFGTDVRKVQHRVEFFLNNREWYDKKGIPYQLGIMLSGLPGTGKTSIIRAIANMTKRHIINVNFANITTATQLKNLFYNERIDVYTDSGMSDTKSFFIPIDQRLYILEEIDAVSDLLKQRDGTEGKENGPVVADELTLGEILTVLDGTMEIPGRMIIMTSNHPEFLDKALLRPGRIDVNAKFGNASCELIAEMFEEYLETPFPRERVSELPNDLLTPAEASEVIMRYCKTSDIDIDQIIRELSNRNVHTETTPNSSGLLDTQKDKDKDKEQDDELPNYENVQKNLAMTKNSVAHLELVATKFNDVLSKLSGDKEFNQKLYQELSYDHSVWTTFPQAMNAISRVYVYCITQYKSDTGLTRCIDALQERSTDDDAQIHYDIESKCPPSMDQLWNLLKKNEVYEVHDGILKISGIPLMILYNTYNSVSIDMSTRFKKIVAVAKNHPEIIKKIQHELSYDVHLWSLYSKTLSTITKRYIENIVKMYEETNDKQVGNATIWMTCMKYAFEGLYDCVSKLKDVPYSITLDEDIHRDIERCDGIHAMKNVIQLFHKETESEGPVSYMSLDNFAPI